MDPLLELIGILQPYIAAVPTYVLFIVLTLTSLFLLGYLFQGMRVWLQLRRPVKALAAAIAQNKRPRRQSIAELFPSEPLRHLWAEYADTLHELHRGANANGEAIRDVRATVPAETFFTREALVDSRMFDDFTRHLPGVLTGLGIIGTFAGLLDGLLKFNPTSAASAVAGLKPLLDGVAHAFIASAIAISAAMLVTFISRLVLARFYGLVERLNQHIDALYATGAGEEYLSRLVQASEKSEAHAAQLKQALVEDLTKLMTNLTERQIQAQADASKALGSLITGALEPPLQQMTDAIRVQTEGNTEAVSNTLETLLTGFMAKLEDTFGGQIRGINDQVERSMQAMTVVQQAMTKLVEDINQSSERATSRLSGSLEEAMKQAAANQGVLTDQMREFVSEFRRLVAEEQDKSRQAMDDSMTKVLTQLSESIAQLEGVRKAAAAEESARSDRLSQHTEQVVGGLTGHVDTILKAVTDQVAATQRNIEAISGASKSAIDGLNNGAMTMTAAAQRFETAGNSVTGVFERSAKVSEQLASTATTLQAAATSVRQGFEQYDSTRKTVDSHVAALTALIESAKREAGASKQMVEDLERIVRQLKDAERQSAEYLEGVNGALVEAFTTFGTQLTGAIQQTLQQTDKHLGNGVQQLTGVVQEISATIARLKKAA